MQLNKQLLTLEVVVLETGIGTEFLCVRALLTDKYSKNT